MKRLLVTSDDFGMCHAINAGTLLAMEAGIVRSTNLMAPCPWFEEAARLCRTRHLAAGVHLTLTCEWDQLRWPSLTHALGLRADDGCLPTSHAEVAAQASLDELRAELVAQLERVERAGVPFTHLDTHMLPPSANDDHACRVQGLARELASRCGVPFTYEQREERPLHFRDTFEISAFDDATIWERLESWSEPGDYALSGHAGCASDELRSLSSRPDDPWAERYRARDLAFFTDESTRRRLDALGFTLVGIRDLFG